VGVGEGAGEGGDEEGLLEQHCRGIMLGKKQLLLGNWSRYMVWTMFSP
jgi:hypothetical protein